MPVTDVTAGAVVEKDGKYLIVEERASGRTVLTQPGGHLEACESSEYAVERETLEETAWHFEPEAITGIYLWLHPDGDRYFLRISYCGHCRNHDPTRTLDEGILRALWLDRDELVARAPQLRTPMVMRSIDDFLAGQRLPCDAIRQLPVNEIAERAAVVG